MQMENISYDAADKSTPSVAASRSPDYSDLSNPFLSPTSNSSLDGGGGDTDRRLRDASCILEYQQLYNRHTLCLAQLRDSIEEVDALRLENDSLRFTNEDLSQHVALLFSRDRLFSDYNSSDPRAAAQHHLNEYYCVERRNTERVALPKSISVRSGGYQKMNPNGGRDKAATQPAVASRNKEESVEMEVYNQGMWKTELCNKWQETGGCPYEHNCEFAHGIKELRPVIRHPRYKTEVCRMVLAGDICPYGHRCHFRHSLTQQERLMAAQSSR